MRRAICLGIEVPPKFRLPRVTSPRRHHEREDDEDPEAGIHRRVQGIGREASQRWTDSRRGGQGVGVGRTNLTKLGQGGRGRPSHGGTRCGLAHTRARTHSPMDAE